MTNIVKICYKANFVQETKLLHLQKRTWWKDKAARWESGGEIVKLARWVSEVK